MTRSHDARRHEYGTAATRNADSVLAKLRSSAAPLRARGPARTRARIPLERAELELARVVCIEMAHELERARSLVASPDPTEERALQRDVAETIAVARACGVPVPRVMRRLVAGARATWPAPARMACWAQRLAR